MRRCRSHYLLPPLLFRHQLFRNGFRNIIVSLQRRASLDILDEAFEVMGLQFVMLLPHWIPPTVRI